MARNKVPLISIFCSGMLSSIFTALAYNPYRRDINKPMKSPGKKPGSAAFFSADKEANLTVHTVESAHSVSGT